MAEADTFPMGARLSTRRLSRKCTSSGLPRASAATAIRYRLPRQRQPSIEDVILGAIPGLAESSSAQSRAGV